MDFTIQSDEESRLQQLKRYKIMFTAAETFFDEIVALMVEITGAKYAGISFIDQDTHWFKAQVGFGPDQRTRETSFCFHVLRADAPLSVADLSQDPYLVNHPLVLEAPQFRSYLGVPLRTPSGDIIGVLCCVDQRKDLFDERHVRIFQLLAFHIINYMEFKTK